jgi:hypothetical protein
MVIPIQPTTLMDIPSGTILQFQVYKPHKGCICIIGVAPNGDYKAVDQWYLHDKDRIDQNAAGETLADLPDGWVVETAQERAERVARESKEELA